MKVYLTIHYSDSWADPGQQNPPAAWDGLTLAELRDSVYNYTEQVITAIKPEYVSIGNEINGGMLWETGRIENGSSLYTMKTVVSDLAMTFGKPVLIDETAYPFTLGWEDMTHNSIGLEEQLSPGYEATPEGQHEFLTDLKTRLSEVEDCAGFCAFH